jgi:carbamoyltransferase
MATRPPDTVLGISHSHDAGVALVQGGRVIAAANEERFSRRKQDGAFPRRALEWLLGHCGIAPHQIDRVALAGRHLYSLHSPNNDLTDEDGSYRWSVGLAESIDRTPGLRAALTADWGTLAYRHAQATVGRLRIVEYRRDLRSLGITAPVRTYDHHDCHLAGAYLMSGRPEDCLVISNDGFGDGLSAKVALGRGGYLQELSRTSFYHSLGILYGYATDICGFPRIWHAGKTTGLAAYGRWMDTWPVFQQAMVWDERRGRYECRIGLFRLAQRWLRTRLDGCSREDIAAGIQRLTEGLLVRQLRCWRRRTGANHVAVAGGVHANVRANQAMASEPGVESYFVFPHMGDGGLPLGAALLASRESAATGLPLASFEHLYLGPRWSESELERVLAARRVPVERPTDLPRRIAELVADGKVIARFDGAMEYGPRALGNRSILYRALDPSANDWLNERLGRTEFMPFAPVMRDVDAPRLIDGYGPATAYAAKFMTITYPATAACLAEAPACVHRDGTLRPQVIDRSANPAYYDILSAYHALTGRAVLINTSFNMHEEPIVCSPDDALRAFEASGLDHLVLGPFLIPQYAARVPGLQAPQASVGAAR